VYKKGDTHEDEGRVAGRVGLVDGAAVLGHEEEHHGQVSAIARAQHGVQAVVVPCRETATPRHKPLDKGAVATFAIRRKKKVLLKNKK
jgi:hypothetical protein